MDADPGTEAGAAPRHLARALRAGIESLPVPRTGPYFALFVLTAVNTVNFYDRQVLGALGEPIRKEFHLGDQGLGTLTTAFTLVYALIGLPLGRLADTAPRKIILAAGVAAWSLLTAATAASRSYWQLFLLRIGVGLGEASCAPAATALLGDLFPAKKRGRSLSTFMLGLPLGLALSYCVSGRVAQDYGWRAAFFVAGIPGIVLACVLLFLREPARGAAEAIRSAAPPGSGDSPYRRILSRPTFLWIIASGAIHNFNQYAIGSFLTPYFMRVHGLKLDGAGDAAMVVSLCGIPGLLLGGLAADAASRRGPSGRLVLGAAASLACAPLAFLALATPAGDSVAFTCYFGAACGLMYVYYSSVYATIQDVVEPQIRGTAMAVYFFAMYVFGAAFGPWATGAMSDAFARAAARAAGLTELTAAALEPFRGAGLRSAMHVVPILAVVLAAVLLAAARTANRDASASKG